MNEDARDLSRAARSDSAIRRTNERLNFVSQDKEFLRTYHLREMALSDWTTGVNTAREEGKIEGKVEGKIEVAEKLLHIGLSIEQIQEATGLDMESIRRLGVCRT